jgi:hypothetical protein
MKTTNRFIKLAFTAAIVFLFSATSQQSAFADKDHKSLVGSWIVDIVPDFPGPPPFKNLATVHKDNTIVTSDPALGVGQGAWKRTGKKGYEIKFVVLIGSDPAFPPDSTATITASLTVDANGDGAHGRSSAVFSDSYGNVMFTVPEAPTTFTRIKVDKRKKHQ